MSAPTPRPTRRQILAGTSAFAAVPLARQVAPAPAELPRRALGRTGRELPVLGLGCFPLGNLEDAEAGIAVARHAWEQGVRYFDTAPSYSRGESERRVGRALAEVPREELFVNTKTLERDGDKALLELEASLERLGMEYVDSVQVHECRSIEDAEGLVKSGAVVPALVQAKKDKKIRHVGITGHRQPEFLLRALELFDFETALVPVSPLDCHHHSFTRGFLQEARERKVGVIAMKIYAGGTLVGEERPVAVADLVRFAVSRPGVCLAVPGADSVARFDEARAGSLLDPPDEEEADAWIDAAGPHLGKKSEWYKSP